ncbi:MAG: hypothetical protein KAJ22_04630 [Candidatus Izimaplasma sp.]|nr:hypothetical protein [Candidatus Izimaplasma bacterium]
MQGFFVVLIILVGVIGLYLVSYYLNAKTEVPEGIDIEVGCDGCNSKSCSLRGTIKEDEDCDIRIE